MAKHLECSSADSMEIQTAELREKRLENSLDATKASTKVLMMAEQSAKSLDC